ncbi:transferase [Mycolicibacterium sp. 050158]|uniref:transferase n=1 Tax=Mycolicibacterium sp. 050158 TaxID=3090602 RepID=UPI00299DF139|nr:transferase [Mycolicibacterium sp. 050158]MDX1892474.1 transferase [Mycolicibacterium sp. 050158]
MIGCRGCGEPGLSRVMDLGKVPPADHFPPAASPVDAAEASHHLAMDLCSVCGLAQLAEDDTTAEEPRGVEPQALRDQAAAAVELAAADGWLVGGTVHEFGSPHGGTWMPLLTARGHRAADGAADVVLDCFGIMHDADQRAAFALRAGLTKPDGVLFVQFHSLAAIVRQGQWNALRHGHFAYYSLSALQRLLGAVGMRVATAWEFDLYGGTVLVAAVHGQGAGDTSVRRILDAERELGIDGVDGVAGLQRAANDHAMALRGWLEREADAGRSVLAYGAASRAVALFSRAGLDTRLIAAIADAAPAKQGRRMPATDIPIVSPAELLAANPDRVLLTLPDLLPELTAALPRLAGRWQLDSELSTPLPHPVST